MDGAQAIQNDWLELREAHFGKVCAKRQSSTRSSPARRDRRREEFRIQTAFRNMYLYKSRRFCDRSVRIEKEKNRRSRAAERSPKHALFGFQLLKRRQQRTEFRAVRLMDAVLKRGAQQIRPALDERREEQHGVLYVRYRIRSRILRRKDAARFFSRETLIWNRKQKRPLPFRAYVYDLGLRFARHARNCQPAHPAGRRVIRVMFAARRFANDLSIIPTKPPEVHGQSDSCKPRCSR